MKHLIIFSVLLSAVLNLVLVWLFWANSGDLTTVQRIESVDTVYIKTMPQTLDFDVNKQAVVYVPERIIERYLTEKQPIYHYYKDSITVIKNNEKPIKSVATLDTIVNDDGEFRISALSPTPLYGLSLDYTLNQMEITKTVLPKHQLFVGGNIGLNTDFNQLKFGTEVQYQLNGQHGFKYEYDWVNGVHSIGYLKRININKLKK